MDINLGNLSNFGVKPGFIEANTRKPIVGRAQNDYLRYTVSGLVEVAGLVSGDFVTVTTGDMVKITAKAIDLASTGGILLHSQNQVATQNSLSQAVMGATNDVAVLGSGVNVYVACDASVMDAAINAVLEIDFVTGKVKVGSADSGLTIAGPVKEGYRKVIDADGNAVMEETLCVLVRI